MEEQDRAENSVGKEHEETETPQEDFASLFEASQARRKVAIAQDSKVSGTVVSIGGEWVFVDIGAKSEGCISRAELLDDDRKLAVKVGDPLSAYVVHVGPEEILLSVKMTSAASEEAVKGAFDSGVPVEGLVQTERKGGYGVSIFGKSGFCPYSQIDLQAGGLPEDYVGKRFTFRIIEYSEGGRNIVVSRREILEEERLQKVKQLRQDLKPGDVVAGTVQNLAHFGAFVDIGGVEGLIPMSELAWHRVGDASEVLSPGDRVDVRILDLDWDNNRISLSLKQMLDDPWNSAAERYREQSTCSGRVTRLMTYGAFVELEPGVEGLIHISNLGAGRRINHPKEVVAEGDEVEVRVLSVDTDARRIGLELILSGSFGATEPSAELKEGDVVTGTVDSVKEYGVFFSLPGGMSGLLHVSEISGTWGGDLRSRFPLGSTAQVEILAIDPKTNKISLSTKRLSERIEESHFKEFTSGPGRGGSLGTLGDLLKEKLKG